MSKTIMEMAREAGMEQDGDNFFSPSHEEIDVHITDLERFAKLVREDERETCAKVCEQSAQNYYPAIPEASGACTHLADAIRARGQA